MRDRRIDRRERYSTITRLVRAGNLSEPLAEVLADEVHPAGVAGVAAGRPPVALRRRLRARGLTRAQLNGARSSLPILLPPILTIPTCDD